MPNTPRNVEEKPYNACLDCANLGKICDGPNFLAMTIDRWVEWCRMRKMYLGWTAQKLADVSSVSLPTIERIFSGRTKDPSLSTVQLITKALVNGSWGQYPCADPNGESAELAAQCQQLKKDLEDMTDKKNHFKKLSEDRLGMIEDAQTNMKDRKEFLLRKDSEIKFWKILSFTLIGILIVALIALVYALANDAIITL